MTNKLFLFSFKSNIKNEDRLPPATRFPQRSKSIAPTTPAEVSVPEGGKKHHPKRPTLELVDSHIFGTDDKDKNSQKGPRVYETELGKSELFESVSKSSIEYAQSSTFSPPKNHIDEDSSNEDEEDTTQSMEKVAFDLYAHIVNENAKEDDKSDETEATTSDGDEVTTLEEELTTPTTTTTVRTTTTTTTEATTTTTTEPTTTTTEAPRGRGGLTAGRNSNRFKFQGRTAPTTSTEGVTESTEAPKTLKNRFQKPSFAGRSGPKATAKTTPAPVEEGEVKEVN